MTERRAGSGQLSQSRGFETRLKIAPIPGVVNDYSNVEHR
jgi:hypothetical protein